MKKFVSVLLVALLFIMCAAPASAADGEALFSYADGDITKIVAYCDIGNTMTKTLDIETEPIKIKKLLDKLNGFRYVSTSRNPGAMDMYSEHGFIDLFTLTITKKDGSTDIVCLDSMTGGLILPVVSGDVVYVPAQGDEFVFFTDAVGIAEWTDDSPFSPEFTDINMWAKEAITYVYGMDYIDGLSETIFAPKQAMDRATFVVALMRRDIDRGFGHEPSTEAPFTDMPEDAEAVYAINWAYECGIINGMGNNRFNPSGTITREQLITMIYRYHGYLGPEYGELANLNRFPDKDKISNYALEPIGWAVDNGLLIGMPDGRINPQGVVTRAEAATIINRYY